MNLMEQLERIDNWPDFCDFCRTYGFQPDVIDLDYVHSAGYITEFITKLAQDNLWLDIRDYLAPIQWNGNGEEIFYDYDGLRELTDEDLQDAKLQVSWQMVDFESDMFNED